jgi:hypothetical protein
MKRNIYRDQPDDVRIPRFSPGIPKDRNRKETLIVPAAHACPQSKANAIAAFLQPRKLSP